MALRVEEISKIQRLIELINENYKYLVELLQENEYSLNKIAVSPYKLASFERFIVRILNAMIDIAQLIVSACELGEFHSYSEALSLLCEKQILSNKICPRITKVIHIRNILVHDYVQLDFDLLEKNLKKYVEDFKTFAEDIKTFLTSYNSKVSQKHEKNTL